MSGEKSFVTTWWLSVILGLFGVDRFYLGKTMSGIAKLITLGGFGFWWITDLVQLARGVTRDSQGSTLVGYSKSTRNFHGGLALAVLVLLGASNAIPPQTQILNSPAAISTKTPETSDPCSTTRIQVALVTDAFKQGSKNVSEIALVLDLAGAEWKEQAKRFSGSKAEWIEKMSELSHNLKSYIITGSPSDGDKYLDQLFSNMKLIDQVCD